VSTFCSVVISSLVLTVKSLSFCRAVIPNEIRRIITNKTPYSPTDEGCDKGL